MPRFDAFAESLRDLLPANLAAAIESSEMPSLSAGPHNHELAALISDPTASEQIRQIAGSRVEEIRGALWLLAGDIDRSHSISQGIHNSEGSFLHGIMHRREGDFGNAKYWFRRAGSVPIVRGIAEQTDGLYSDPINFVDQCSGVAANRLEPDRDTGDDLCAFTHAQWIELESMLVHLLNDHEMKSE